MDTMTTTLRGATLTCEAGSAMPARVERAVFGAEQDAGRGFTAAEAASVWAAAETTAAGRRWTDLGREGRAAVQSAIVEAVAQIA